MAAELSGHAPKDGDGHEYRQSRICGQLFGSRTGDDQPLGRLVDSFGCLEEVFNSNSFHWIYWFLTSLGWELAA